MLRYGHALIYCLDSILSCDLYFEPHAIISCYAFTKNKKQKMIFEKELDIQKLIRMITPFFENFLKVFFVLETKLEMIGTIIL